MHQLAFQGFKVYSPYRGQGRVLSLMLEQPEIKQRDLASQLDISKQALAELLSKMEKNGYITRKPSRGDRRVLAIHLTEAGREAAHDAGEGIGSLSDMLDCLDDAEMDAFRAYLARIIAYNREKRQANLAVREEDDETCEHCTGLDSCTFDFLKYGHDKPSAEHCRFIQKATAEDGKTN